MSPLPPSRSDPRPAWRRTDHHGPLGHSIDLRAGSSGPRGSAVRAATASTATARRADEQPPNGIGQGLPSCLDRVEHAGATGGDRHEQWEVQVEPELGEPRDRGVDGRPGRSRSTTARSRPGPPATRPRRHRLERVDVRHAIDGTDDHLAEDDDHKQAHPFDQRRGQGDDGCPRPGSPVASSDSSRARSRRSR